VGQHIVSDAIGKRREARAGSVEGPALTWTHVKGGAAAIVGREEVSGRKTKVSQLDIDATVSHKNVLRLQIPVVDPLGMAKLNGIQDLQENALGQKVVSHIMAAVGDAGEQIPLRAEFDDHIGAVGIIQDLDQRNHIGMLAGMVVKPDLPLLELSLPRIQA
jgi:hypothetical protein